MKKLAYTGLVLLLIMALSLAGIAAYQSIIGLAVLFAARAEVVILMAIFIEWAKLVFAGAIHMFWKTLPWWKWLGVGIIAIHMAVTNIGIYSYLSSGYTLQEAPVAAIDRKIVQIDQTISQQKLIEEEALREIQAMNIAYEGLVKKQWVTRAERYERQNAEKRKSLESSRDSARSTIADLRKERSQLEEEKVANAAKLGSIEHISAFGEDVNVMQVVAMFTVLLMLGLDPAAIIMVIMFTHFIRKMYKTEEPETKVEVVDSEPHDDMDTTEDENTNTEIESSEPIPNINTHDLPQEVIEEAKRLHKIGYLDNRLKAAKNKRK